MEKIELFTKDDIKKISNNMDDMMKKILKNKKEKLAPLLKDIKKIKKIIYDFIKSKKRILYGGTAWNHLIKDKKEADCFYDDDEHHDIEFYSVEPIKDLKEICDIFNKEGYQYVTGTNASHAESYIIFVDFHEYCNITYMPGNIYYSQQVITINGLRIIHPRFAVIDVLRMYCDPYNGLWRLDKAFERSNILFKHYPLEVSTIKKLKKPLTGSKFEILKKLFTYCTKQKLIFIDYNIQQVYIEEDKTKIKFNDYNIEVISDDYENDIKNINNFLLKQWNDDKKLMQYKEDIKIKEYWPFFQFLDKRTEFYYKDTLILTVYGNNHICVPYNNIKYNGYNIMIGTFNVVLLYILINNLLAHINNDKNKIHINNYRLHCLINAKNQYLKKHKKTIIDDTIYKDLQLNCYGKAMDSLKRSKQITAENKISRKVHYLIYTYDPAEIQSRENFKVDSYYFTNKSGNIINVQSELIFKDEIIDTKEL